MNVIALIKPEKLLEYLDIEAQQALLSKHVFPLSTYAWNDENTASDEFVGLAKWELESPETSLNSSGSQSAETRKKLIVLETTGEDLRGLMEMARKSIGLALVYSESSKREVFDLHDTFWIHHLSAMTMLSMASDRLRDLFLLGCLGQTAKEYKKGKPDGAKHYDHPFRNVRSFPWAQQFQVELSELADLAIEIYAKGVDKRNKLVHELASKLGKLARDTAGTGNAFQSGQDQTHAEAKKAWDTALAKHEAEIEEAIQSLVDWYKRLVKATAIVCDIEHAIR